MAQEKPLTEQEKRYLGALRLFMESSEDPKHRDAGKLLDEMSAEAQRHIIASYHFGLENPQAFLLANKIRRWVLPILRSCKSLIKFLQHKN